MPEYKEERESKVWNPILEGRKKIAMGGSEYVIHVGYICILLIVCVSFVKAQLL